MKAQFRAFLQKVYFSPSSHCSSSEMLELVDALETDSDRFDLGKSPISLSFLRLLI